MFETKSPEEYLEKGEEYLQQGEYEKAINEYEKAIKADPNYFFENVTIW